MADDRLPGAVTDILETPLGENITVPHVDPVRVRTRDEVSDVADALNTVQDTALDLAVEQAVLRRNIADSFVNLGRRNQNLLGRQLDFITELETNETNPDALSNLFRLDHLATRMRRNAESLLVLAGIEPPRQWAAPVRLTDVIRAALGEVESYQRVTVRGVEPATIVGSAAADLAHLLAELIENALVFSPPDQTVDIRGRTRNDGGYTLAVIDAGLGMAATDVAAANRRLAGAESFTIAPSKYLGHYVAGNLAARHDIKVRLDNSPGNGITATVSVPPALLTNDEVTSAPVTPPHGQRVFPGHTLAVPPVRPQQHSGPQPALPSALQGPEGGVPAGVGGPGANGPGGPNGPGSNGPTGPGANGPSWTGGPNGPLDTGAGTGPRGPERQPAQSWPAPAAPRPAPAPAPGGAESPPPLWPRSNPIAARERGPAGPNGAPAPGADAPVTASGLSRRTPAARSRTVPAAADDQAVLDALARYAPPGSGAGTGPAASYAPTGPTPSPLSSTTGPTAPVPPAPTDAASSPLTPPDALTRRVKGAQLPQTAVVSLHRDRRHTPPAGYEAPAYAPPAPPAPARAATTTPAPGSSRATDVQSLLTSFTAGVQRGLDDARQHSTRRSTGATPAVDAPYPG
jgi:signal transduction histidine kinase